MTKCVPHRNHSSRNKATAFLAGLLFVLPCALQAGEGSESLPSRPLSLHDCIAIALGESPALEASRYDIAAAAEEARAAQGFALPQLSGTASAEIFSGEPTGKFQVVNAGDVTGVGLSTSKSVNLEAVDVFTAKLRYPLFKDGSILGLNNPPAVAEKKAKKQAAAWTLHLRREEVIYRITDSFIATVSALNRTDFVQRRVSLLEQSVGITQEQQKQGLALPIDVKVAQDQLTGARSLAKILREQAVAGEYEMARLLGLPASSKVRLVNTLPDPPDPPSAEEILGASLNQHPSLQVQRAVIDQAKQKYRLERFRLYPSVSLDGSLIYIDDFNPPGANVYTGAVTVNVPIFDFGAQLATARSKMMTYRAEQARLLSVADDVTYEVLKTYQEIYVLGQNILSLQDEVSKTERDLRVAASQREQGIAEPLTTIEKELHFIAKRDDLEGLQARRLTLFANLQRAVGGAWKWIP